jgi:hypothetical protein
MLLLVFREKISSFHNPLRFLGSFSWRTQYRPQAHQHKILSFILRYRHRVLKNQELITRTSIRPVSAVLGGSSNRHPRATDFAMRATSTPDPQEAKRRCMKRNGSHSREVWRPRAPRQLIVTFSYLPTMCTGAGWAGTLMKRISRQLGANARLAYERTR